MACGGDCGGMMQRSLTVMRIKLLAQSGRITGDSCAARFEMRKERELVNGGRRDDGV